MEIPSNDWFAKDFIRLRDRWIAEHGYQTLCEDAGRAGVDGVEFPEVVEPKYRCKLCQAPMVARKGPFGEFLACPKGTKEVKHPTQRMPADYHMVAAVGRIERFHPAYYQEPLSLRVEREMIAMGGGLLTDTERFCLGPMTANATDYFGGSVCDEEPEEFYQ